MEQKVVIDGYEFQNPEDAKIANEELAKVKQQVTATAQGVLNESTAKVKERFGDFEDIQSLMDEQINRLEVYKKELEKKYREGEERLNAILNAAKDAATKAAQEAIMGSTDAAKETVTQAAEDAAQEAVNALKGLFGR